LRPGTEGRFSLVPRLGASGTERASALAENLLTRHGIVTRETLRREDVPGGFTALYPVLRALEEAGRVRRGYFVSGLGGAQFAFRGAEGRLRAARERGAIVLAACDPANAYGATLPWPRGVEARFARTSGTFVVLWQGRLLAYVGKGHATWTLLCQGSEEDAAFVDAVQQWFERSSDRAWIATTIDGEPATSSRRAPLFERAGFVKTGDGLLRRRG
jgi:ATP-dependent Lhr-like helicase